MTDLNPEFVVQDEAGLRALFPPTHAVSIAKSLPALEKHSRDYINRAPFLCIGTQSADGTADVSPRGDPRGFVKVLDDKTLLIPDRPGNNRLDTLANIVANPSVGLLFIIPGFDDTLRINGRASISHDPALLDQLKVHDRAPRVAIVVQIDEVFLHCAKAFRRSKLWDPNELQDRSELPSILNIIHEQSTGQANDAETSKVLDAKVEESYRTTMY